MADREFTLNRKNNYFNDKSKSKKDLVAWCIAPQ